MIEQESDEFKLSDNLIGKNLFGVPIYKTRFKDHLAVKPRWLEYLSDKENFRKNTTMDRLLFTSSNLHKESVFSPLTNLVENSLKQIMEDWGYLPNIGITGMWGTVQPDGGFHHRHHHHNSYLAGVYYLDGSEDTSGTTFYSPNYYESIMTPARNNDKKLKLQNTYNQPFVEGELIIFPAWLQHSTGVNNLNITKKYRKVIAFNAMPTGRTNSDIFDRYYYPEPDSSMMINERDELYNYKPREKDVVDTSEYFNQQHSDNNVEQTHLEEINNLKEEVNSIKSDLTDIKDLLIKALGK